MQNGDCDIYLDIYDDGLQTAVKNGNPQMITKYIEEGLEQSSHVMCLVSEGTIKSWWVPYELGYGKRANKDLSTLTLKGTVTLPPFLEISTILRGTKSLNDYLQSISDRVSRSVYESLRQSLKSHVVPIHPLDNYLDWKY